MAVVDIDFGKKRSCGSCTKCCEGWLMGNVRGYDMYPGKQCFFLKEAKCSDYENRPEIPCKSFNCDWLKYENIVPEEFKPEVCGVILTSRRTISGIPFLYAVPAPNSVSAEILSWMITTANRQHGLNLKWHVDDKMYCYGSDQFLQDISIEMQNMF